MAADPDYRAGCGPIAAGGCLIGGIPAIRHGQRRGGFPG